MILSPSTFLLTFLAIILSTACFEEGFAYPLNEIICDTSCMQPFIADSKLEVVPVVTGLTAPSNMAFLDSNDILVLERYSGEIRRIINDTLQPIPFFDVNVAAGAGERGLLGIAVSRDSSHTYVFLYFTESKSDGGAPIGNRLYRYELVNDHLSNPKLLLDLPYSPGPYHNGGGMVIGPDKNVYLTIGDLDNVDDKIRPNMTIQNNPNGAEPNGSGGILRITQNGDIVGNGILGNSYPLNLYYGYGIRNSFGIDFDPITGHLWDTENGPNYGDEINLVEPGYNGGWTKVQGVWLLKGSNPGKETDGNVTGLVDFNGQGKFSFPEFTWKGRYGPTGLKFLDSDKLGKEYENDLFLGDVHFGTLYHFDLNKERSAFLLNGSLSDKIANSTQEINDLIFGKGFGGITDVEVGYDGYLYVVSYAHGSIYRIIPNK